MNLSICKVFTIGINVTTCVQMGFRSNDSGPDRLITLDSVDLLKSGSFKYLKKIVLMKN